MGYHAAGIAPTKQVYQMAKGVQETITILGVAPNDYVDKTLVESYDDIEQAAQNARISLSAFLGYQFPTDRPDIRS